MGEDIHDNNNGSENIMEIDGRNDDNENLL